MENNEAYAALVKRMPNYLDRPIEELVKMSAVGSVYLSTHKALLRKIKSGQIGLAEQDRKTKLAEGQAIGEALLDVERKIGELSLQEPPVRKTASPKGTPRGGGSLPSGVPPKHERLGLGRAQVESAQAIARHPEAVAKVTGRCKNLSGLPDRSQLLHAATPGRGESHAGRFGGPKSNCLFCCQQSH